MGHFASQSYTLYGFSIPFGSNNFFILLQYLRISFDFCSFRYSGFLDPIPCSALILPWFLTTSSKIPFSFIFGYSPFLIHIFKCKLPSPICPYPTTYPPAFSLTLATNSHHFLTSNDTSYFHTRPYLLAASATPSLIFQISLNSFSLVDMMESWSQGMEERNSPRSEVVVQINKRWEEGVAAIIYGWRCLQTRQQEQPSRYYIALRCLPRSCLAFQTMMRMFQYLSVFRRRTCRFVSTFEQLMSSLVIMPRVPSDPMNNCLRSMPVLSFLIVLLISNTVPSANTTSIPSILPLNGPYLIKYLPAACVEAFPPIIQLPLLPKSNGTSYPYSFKCQFRNSSTHPASHLNTPLTVSKPSTLFIFFRLTTISSNIETLPPTRPVLPL